jgi:hypothetical protein
MRGAAVLNVLLLQLDGKIPNLALMRIAAHHRGKGDQVTLAHARTVASVERGLWDKWDLVYASLIFRKTLPVAKRLLDVFPAVRIGGTGWDLGKPIVERMTLERLGIDAKPDYSDYAFPHSLGYTQRGCRLRCSFCDVSKAEGRVKSVGGVYDVWRGEPWPKNLLLLDNDFFGQAEWRERIEEIKAGGFKVCWNQGFNVRLINDEQAAAIATVPYFDDQFKTKRLYTAWDNLKDEDVLFRNLESLVRHGVRPSHILVYMLIGYWPGETEQQRDYRRAKLRAFGALPYPMPYERTPELVGFQRWVLTHYDQKVPWAAWKVAGYQPYRLKWDHEMPLLDE